MKTVKLQVVEDRSASRAALLSAAGPNLETDIRNIPETVNLNDAQEVRRAKLNIHDVQQELRRMLSLLDGLSQSLPRDVDPMCVRGCGHTRHTGVCGIAGCNCPHGV